MRNRCLPILALLTAIAAVSPLAADDAAVEPPAPEAPAANPAQPEPLLPEAAESAGQTPAAAPDEELFDPTHGAVGAETCWTEYKTWYECTCPGARYRKLVEDRLCCVVSGCGPWGGLINSCTNYPCP